MDAIEKRARELLAAQYTGPYGELVHEQIVQNDGVMNSHQLAALRALIHALTPPEGFVLMPRVLTEEMLQAGYPAGDAQAGYEAMIAARPEVP